LINKYIQSKDISKQIYQQIEQHRMEQHQMEQQIVIRLLYRLKLAYLCYFDQFAYITHLELKNYNSSTKIKLPKLPYLVVLKLENLYIKNMSGPEIGTKIISNIDDIPQYPRLEIIQLNKCNLTSIPKFILQLKKIKEIHLENNFIYRISNDVLDLHKLHILNLIGNNIHPLQLSVLIFDTYCIGLQPVYCDFVKNKTLFILLNEIERKLV